MLLVLVSQRQVSCRALETYQFLSHLIPTPLLSFSSASLVFLFLHSAAFALLYTVCFVVKLKKNYAAACDESDHLHKIVTDQGSSLEHAVQRSNSLV